MKARIYRPATWSAVASVLCAAATAQATSLEDIGDLRQLSIEELSNIEVTSVSKRPEKLVEAPAAIQVLVGEEIRRSGASNIPGALRSFGNLDVAQENAHEWVISARGFSSDVGNKLLVLMDGRSIYTPLFSGVFWDRQDYIMEDINRIEVISGPGGTLWGANAVNGVINITTKTAEDTQGFYAEGGGGINPQAFGSLRYGGRLGADTFFRVYGKYTDRGSDEFENGARAGDNWDMVQTGFRIDTQAVSNDAFTLQGDYYTSTAGIIGAGKAKTTGGNVLGRWTRTFSDTSDMSLQMYYDRTHLRLPTPAVIFAPPGVFTDDLDTIDIDFQHGFQLAESHRVMWGLGYRYTHDVVQNSPGIGFFPTTLDQNLYSGFVQDKITLRDDVFLTVGTKVEHTSYTGFEFEPSVRLQWSIDENHSLWTAASRAVRTPSRIDREISQPTPGYLIVILQGGQNFQSETVTAYEAGYRGQFNDRFGGALSVFYNDYDKLRSTTPSPPDPIFGLPFPFFFENNLEGETYGLELNANVQLTDWWLVRASYRLIEEDLRIRAGAVDFNNMLNETNDAKQAVTLRSAMDLPYDLELDGTLRWVDTRKMNNAGVRTHVPAYAELDVRLAWDIPGPLEFSVVGQNLLHDSHPEFGVPGPTRVQIRRSVYGKVAWKLQ